MNSALVRAALKVLLWGSELEAACLLALLRLRLTQAVLRLAMLPGPPESPPEA